MAKAKTPGKRPQGGAKAVATGGAIAVDSPEPKKPRTSPVQFYQQVMAEARKIVWPSRKETWITSVMVGIIVVLASIFVFTVDSIIGWAMGLIFQLANAG